MISLKIKIIIYIKNNDINYNKNKVKNKLNFKKNKDGTIDYVYFTREKELKNNEDVEVSLNNKTAINSDKDNYNKIKSYDKLNKLFISYKLHYYNKEKKLFWPINVIYGGKKFYCMTPNNQKLNVNKNTLLYYCNRHRKVSRKNENIKCCNDNIIYVRNEDSFYFKKDHSR